MKLRRTFPVGILASVFFFAAIAAHARTFNAFGPVTYERSSGKPQTVTNSFSVLNPNTQYALHIDSNGVSSAVISVDGTQVFGPSDFNANVSSLDSAVTLSTQNVVSVELRGTPGNSLTITVIGVDNDPPVIVPTISPSPNPAGWNNTNVTVSFTCSDATSGAASCPSPVTISMEGAGQNVSGTAIDNAGNTASVSVVLNIDKTPPSVAIFAPLNNQIVTSPDVSIQGSATDNLSGVASVSVNGVLTTVVNGGFSLSFELPFSVKTIAVTAVDLAGNIGTTQQMVFFSPLPQQGPVLLARPPTAAVVGKTLSFRMDAASGDPNSLVFSLPNAPTGMTIDPTGLISWTPAQDQAGDHPITFVAADSTGQTSQSFTLSVFSSRPVASTFVPAATGGVVVVNDPSSAINGLSINIAAGALIADTTIDLSELVAPPTLGGTSHFLLKGFSIDPDGTALAIPATITVPYDPSEFNLGGDVPVEEFLGAYLLDASRGSLAGLDDFGVDTTNHTITGTVPHFSFYAITNRAGLFPPPTRQSNCPGPPPQSAAAIPALLVHGFEANFFGGVDTWGQLPMLLNQVDCQGQGPIQAWRFVWDTLHTSFEVSAFNLATAITKIKQITGQPAVNIVAHSFGGILVRTYLQDQAKSGSIGIRYKDRSDVNRVMTLGTPHQGIGGKLSLLRTALCANDRTCFEVNTGSPSARAGQGDFLRNLNTLPLPTLNPQLSPQYDVIRGQRLDGQLGIRDDDGLITMAGSDLCTADPQACTPNVLVHTFASSASDNVGLCHSAIVCTSPIISGKSNLAMVEVTHKDHLLWQEICTFLGGDPVKCKPQLRVNTVSTTGGTVVDITSGSINCGATCSAAYDSDTSITLQANPQLGFTFSGWSGDCSGTGPCVVNMDDDKNISAHFVPFRNIQITSVSCTLTPLPSPPFAPGTAEVTVQSHGSVTEPDVNTFLILSPGASGGLAGNALDCGVWTRGGANFCMRTVGEPSTTVWSVTFVSFASTFSNNGFRAFLTPDFSTKTASASAPIVCQ